MENLFYHRMEKPFNEMHFRAASAIVVESFKRRRAMIGVD